jgi:hypothetical protein
MAAVVLRPFARSVGNAARWLSLLASYTRINDGGFRKPSWPLGLPTPGRRRRVCLRMRSRSDPSAVQFCRLGAIPPTPDLRNQS